MIIKNVEKDKIKKEMIEEQEYEIKDAIFRSAFLLHRPVDEVGVGNVIDEIEAKDIADRGYHRIMKVLNHAIDRVRKKEREELKSIAENFDPRQEYKGQDFYDATEDYLQFLTP